MLRVFILVTAEISCISKNSARMFSEKNLPFYLCNMKTLLYCALTLGGMGQANPAGSLTDCSAYYNASVVCQMPTDSQATGQALSCSRDSLPTICVQRPTGMDTLLVPDKPIVSISSEFNTPKRAFLDPNQKQKVDTPKEEQSALSYVSNASPYFNTVHATQRPRYRIDVIEDDDTLTESSEYASTPDATINTDQPNADRLVTEQGTGKLSVPAPTNQPLSPSGELAELISLLPLLDDEFIALASELSLNDLIIANRNSRKYTEMVTQLAQEMAAQMVAEQLAANNASNATAQTTNATGFANTNLSASTGKLLLATSPYAALPLSHIEVTSPYGDRIDPFSGKKRFHNGVDLRASEEVVYAMLDGTVSKVGRDKKAGIYVTLEHGDFTISYCHLSATAVKKGEIVRAGTILALTGSTGRTTGEHLHITCRYKGKYIDPMIFIQTVNSMNLPNN